jgi:hypothetical protein
MITDIIEGLKQDKEFYKQSYEIAMNIVKELQKK